MKFRAIEPVVATLILIIIAVVAGVSTYGFVTGFIAQTTSQKAPGSIVVDAAKVNASGSPDTVRVITRNVGQGSVTVTAIYVLNANDLTYADSVTGLSGSVSAGGTWDSGTRALSGDTLTSGNWYIVKVVTDDGSSATTKVRAS